MFSSFYVSDKNTNKCYLQTEMHLRYTYKDKTFSYIAYQGTYKKKHTHFNRANYQLHLPEAKVSMFPKSGTIYMCIYTHSHSLTHVLYMVYISCGRTGGYEDSIVQDPVKTCAGAR